MSMLKSFVFCCCMIEAQAVHTEFEQFYQTSGQEYVNCDLRVRKFNRTAPVLNGTVHMLMNMNDSFTFSVDLFHSPLGNQQFNYYPMKLPITGTCAVVDHVHRYYPSFAAISTNVPRSGDCPVTIRQMPVFDQRLLAELVPNVAPPGLWKTLIKGFWNDVQIIEYYLFIKLNQDRK